MKHLLVVCFILCLVAALAPAVNADYIPMTVVYNSTPCTEEGCQMGYLNDGDIGTRVQMSSQTAGVAYDFQRNYSITFCDFYTNSAGALHPNFQFATDCSGGCEFPILGSQWSHAPNAVKDTWMRVNFSPANVTRYLNFFNSGGDWFTYSELRCDASDYSSIPIADFNATPTSGPATLYVFFSDNSTGAAATAWNWSITPTTGVTGYLGNVKDHFAYFAIPGNYTVSHGVSNIFSSDIETKTDHIWVQNWATDYVTSGFVAMDAPRWVQLAGATINLLDVENNSWKNTSSSATGYETITTLNNHTINAYSTMLGYGDASLLSQPASDDSFYILRMFPTGYANVSAGSVTLYVTIFGSDIPDGRLSGATVNIAYEQSGSQHSDYRTTDASGIVQFVVPNQTTIYVYAEKAGYTRGGTTVPSGNGNGGNASVYTDVTLQRAYVTIVPTATTLPGGGTPTATPATVDPYPCDADHPENCERKQTDMANDLIEWGPDLMLLFIMATIIGVIKMMGK